MSYVDRYAMVKIRLTDWLICFADPFSINYLDHVGRQPQATSPVQECKQSVVGNDRGSQKEVTTMLAQRMLNVSRSRVVNIHTVVQRGLSSQVDLEDPKQIQSDHEHCVSLVQQRDREGYCKFRQEMSFVACHSLDRSYVFWSVSYSYHTQYVDCSCQHAPENSTLPCVHSM